MSLKRDIIVFVKALSIFLTAFAYTFIWDLIPFGDDASFRQFISFIFFVFLIGVQIYFTFRKEIRQDS